MVQHLDGFGTRAEKDATPARLRRPSQFHLGYKLVYDEDVKMYAPREVNGSQKGRRPVRRNGSSFAG